MKSANWMESLSKFMKIKQILKKNSGSKNKSKEKYLNYIKTKMEHNIPHNIMRLNQCEEERINIFKKKDKANSNLNLHLQELKNKQKYPKWVEQRINNKHCSKNKWKID